MAKHEHNALGVFSYRFDVFYFYSHQTDALAKLLAGASLYYLLFCQAIGLPHTQFVLCAVTRQAHNTS